MKYHVIKHTRVYSGYGYRGPSLRTAGIPLEAAEFDDFNKSVEAAHKLDLVNPVGWDVIDTATCESVFSTVRNQ